MDIDNIENSTLVTGTDGADYITSSGDNVTIDAGNGADSVATEGTSNLIRGEGNNFVAISGDSTTVITGAGNDSIVNVIGADVSIDAGEGDNAIVNVGTGATIISGSGDDAMDNRSNNVQISTTGGNNAIANSGSNVTISTGSGVDTIYSTGANVSIDAGGGADYFEIEGTGNELGNVIVEGNAGNDTIDIYEETATGVHSGYISVSGGDGRDVINVDYLTGSTTILGGAGNDYIFTTNDNALIDGGEGSDFISVTGSDNTVIAGAGYDTLRGSANIIADVTGSRVYGSNVILTTGDGTLTIVDGAGETLTINGEETVISAATHLNTGVDVMKKFFDVLKLYANDTITSGIDILSEAIRAVSFYSDLYDAVDNFTYEVTSPDTYSDTYDRLRETCGIVIGGFYDFTVDTGAISGYNAGGDTIKNAQDIVPEPAGAVLSDLEMPEAGATTTHTFTGNDGTTHTFTITTPDDFYSAVDSENDNSPLVDVSGEYSSFDSLAKGINNWWAPAAAKLAYDSFNLDFDGKNLYWVFANNMTEALAATARNDTNDLNRLEDNTTPYDNMIMLISLENYGNIDPDNQNGAQSIRTYVDRTIAHEFIHATMFGTGTFKRQMPQFFTEGVADLVHGGDDFNSNDTDVIVKLAESYQGISEALAFRAGTGSDNPEAYPGGYMFLRWLTHQNLDTEIILGTDAADVYEYYGGNAVVYGYDSSDSVTFSDEITGVELSGNDYLIFGSNGSMLLRDASDKNISLNDSASISGETFTITNKIGNMHVGSEYLTLGVFSVTFDLTNGNISGLSGAISGFAGGEYVINGETVSLGAGDIVADDGSGVTVIAGEVGIFKDTIVGGVNVTVSTADFEADTISATVSGNNAVFFTSEGNITVLDGATLLGDSLSNTIGYVGIAGSDFNDTINNSGSYVLVNARGGDDLILVSAEDTPNDGSTLSGYYGAYITVNGGDGDDFISLGSGVENTSVIFSEGSDTLAGANSSTRIVSSNITETIASGGNLVITNDTGTITALGVSDIEIQYNLDNTVSGIEITTGDSNDVIYNVGDNVTLDTGGGNDKITVSGSGSHIITGEGADTVISMGEGSYIETGDNNDVIKLQGGKHTINAGAGTNQISFDHDTGGNVIISTGEDEIFHYSSDTNIIAQVVKTRKMGDNVFITTDDGFVIVRDAVDKTIIVNGEELPVSNLNTGVDIMKNFFNVLSWYTDDKTTSGVDILSEAVRAVSLYRDLADAVDNFIYDITQGEGDIETRLKNAANLIPDGEDTGAVSGYNAGGSEILNAEDIVPESVTSLAEVALPEAGSTSEYTVTGNDGTVINFSVKWQDSFTAARDFTNGLALTELTDQVFSNGENSLSAAEIMEYIPTVAKGMTQWFPAAVKLAYDSYGISFDGKTIEAYFDVNAPYLAVTNPQGKTYYDEPLDTVEIGVNLSEFIGSPLDADDPNGKYDEIMYIDRILAHEMIHGVMYASSTIKNTMPEFFTEGVADLVQGDDDIRVLDIATLASNYEELYNSVSMTPGTGGRFTYAAGDMFLRYLINQNLNTEIVIGTDEADVYEYYGGNAVVSAFDENDSVILYEDAISALELSNGDKLITTATGSLVIRGGAAMINYVVDDEDVEFSAEDTATGDGEEISNSDVLEPIVGTSRNDTINSTDVSTFIDARGGDDLITSSGFSSTIHGGAGNDSIYLEDASIYAEGGAGDDFISIAGANVTIETSAGDDTVTGADSSTVIIVNNPVSVSENLIVTESGSLSVEGSDYSVAYKIITNASDTLISGTSGDDTIMTYGKNVIIDAGGGNDLLASSDYFNTETQLMNLYDSIDSIEFNFTDENLILALGENSITLSGYTGGSLNIDGHRVYAVKSGNSVKIDSSVDYYSVATDATLTGMSAGATVTVNGATFAVNDAGTEITSDGKVVWSGNAENLGGINIMELQDTGDTTALSMLVDSVLKVNTETGYPDFAAVFFHASEEADIPDATGYASSETLTITSADNLQLSGTHFAPETSSGNWVILVCGYGRTRRTMYPFVESYISQGYDVLTIDPRAMGESEGEYVTMGVAESHDLALWTQKIAEIDSSAKIVLHGFSEGAATIMLAAVDSDTTNVTRLVEDCGYTQIRTVFETLAAGSFLSDTFTSSAVFDAFFDIAEEVTGYDVEAAAPIDVISNVTISTLFITGSEDTVATPEMTQALYDACPAETKDIVIVDGAAHGKAAEVDSESYTTTIFEFLGDSNMDTITIAQDETKTINGIVYTAIDGSAQLNLDSDGSVTGIASGKVTAEISGASSSPTITFDATDGAFNFTAEGDTTLNVTYGGAKLKYVSGAVTYTASSMEIPVGTVGLSGTISNIIPFGIEVTAAAATSVSFADGMISLDEGGNLSGTVSLAGTQMAALEIGGGISFDPESREVAFAEGATLSASSPILNNMEISMTAKETVAGKFAFDSTNFGVTYTPSTAGVMTVTVSREGATLFGGDINLREGAVTYSLGNTLSIASGSVMDLTLNGTTFTLTAAGDSPSKISLADGNVVISADEDTSLDIVATRDGEQVFCGNLNLTNGTITYNQSTHELTATQGTKAIMTLAGNRQFAFEVVNDDAKGVMLLNEDGSITYTPDDNGTLRLSILHDGETTFSNDINVESGSINFNPANRTIGLTAGTVATVSIGSATITLTATSEAHVSFAFTDSGISFTPATEDGSLDISLTTSSGTMNANIDVVSGSFIFGGNGAITVTSGTELKVDFGNDYIVGFKTTDDAGGTISIGSGGLTFAPNSGDGGLELSVTRGGETRTTSLDVTGSITYKLDGSISLAEGTVVTNEFEDGNILKITANSAATGSIRFDPENGLTITPADADALSVLFTNGDIDVFDITSIDGTVNYKGGMITALDGTSARYTNYYMESEMLLSTSGGSSSLVITEDTTSYIPNDGATFVLDYLDGDTLEITGGRFMDDYEHAIITAGSTFRTNDDEDYFVLETAGDYNINGAEITTTADGVHVWFSNYDTVAFTADDDVIFNGETLSGDITIVDGEIVAGEIIAEGESVTFDGIVYTAVDGDAELKFYGGKVAGIKSGKVTLTLEGSDDPSITFDDNSDGFDFTATAADNAIEITVAGITNTYRSGTVTYGDGKISVEGGDFTMLGSIYGQAMSADISAEGTIDFEFSATALTIEGENIDVTLNIGETSQNFEISGKFVDNFAARAVSLSEGAVIRSIFEDGTFSVITANTDIENLINLNAEGGFEITSTNPDALTIELTNAEDFSVMTISQIEGTLNYSDDDILTLSDGTSLDVSVYDYKAKVSTSGNSSTFKVEPERIIYTPGEGATLVFDYYEESVVYTEQGGSIIANYDSPTVLTLTEGISLTTNDETITFVLETAGTYNLNGAEITTSSDGVEVRLDNYNTVEFTADSDVIFNGETLSGDITIVNGEIATGDIIAEGESVTIDGVVYTAVDGDAELNLQSGKVAGIKSGKVTAQIADASTSPTITFDATDGAFDFTAAVNTTLNVVYNGVTLQYVSGAITYTASELEIPAGDISVVGFDNIPMNITVNFPEDTTASFSDGTIHFATTESISGTISIYGMTVGTLEINGEISYGQVSSDVSMTAGTTLSANISMLSNYGISVTALDDVSGTFVLNTSPMGVTYTPATDDGAVALAISRGGVTSFNGEVNCRAGSMTFGLDGSMSLASGTILDTTVNGTTITVTASGDEPSKMAMTDGKIAITPGDGSALDLALSRSGVQLLSGSLKLTSGEISYDPSTNEITVTKGTELQVDFGNDYSVTLTATDDAGGALRLGEDGITFAPNSGDGGLELSVTRGGETRTTNLNVTGSLTYRLDGSLSLAEGTVIENSWEDGTNLKITATTDEISNVRFDPETGLTITDENNNLALDFTFPDGTNFQVDKISGTVTYKNAMFTMQEGAEMHYFLLNAGAASSIEQYAVVNSGSFAFGFHAFSENPEESFVSYIASDNSSIDVTTIEADKKLTVISGTLEVNSRLQLLDPGIVIYGAAGSTGTGATSFSFNGDGEYTLNGVKVTVSDVVLREGNNYGTSVRLIDNKSIMFTPGTATISYDGNDYTGDNIMLIENTGEITSLMTKTGESFIDGDRTFNMIADAPTGVTVSTGENSFDVAHVITEAEVEEFDDTTEDDLGKVFEEKVTIAGDDSYTVSSRTFGVSVVSGLSNGASVDAAVVFGGVENAYGTGFKFVTDEEGSFTFGDKNITIAGDNSVTLDIGFNADGTAVVEDYSGLDEGATIIGVSEAAVENTESGVAISGTDEADIIDNSGENVSIDAGEGDNSITSSGENALIETGDGNNEITNSGDGSSIKTGAGDDKISNTDADNVLIDAGAGDNSVVSGCDNVTVISEGGNDTINADGANTSIVAGDGNNVITSSNGSATVISGSGDDNITNLDADAVYINAGDGNNFVGSYLEYTVDSAADTLKNYYESETVITGSGNDTIANYGGYYVSVSTGDGNDSIRSHHSYYNTIDAGAGDDIVILQNGHYQNVNAGAGDDTIIGSVVSGSGNWATGGYATLIGGEGDDYINPSYSNDSYIEGGSGNDTIISRGPRQTIDAGAGDDVISLGSANANESRTETTTSNLIITGVGNDTIYGYDSDSTIQSADVISTELSGKDVILTTDKGTLTIVKGAGTAINVNGEQIATGEFEVTAGEPLEYNGMTFTGSGKVTLAGDVPTLGAGVAVTGAEDVVLTAKGFNTINGQALQLTEKVPLGVTVATIEDGISMAHVISEEDFAEYVGRIFKEEAYVYGDDEYFVRVDAGGIRSIFGLSSGVTVEGKGHTETEIGSGVYEDDYSVLQLGLSEAGTYTFNDKEYTIGELTSDTPVGVNVHYETDSTAAVTFIRYLNGNTISGDFTGKEVSVGSDKAAQIVSIAGDDSVSITGGTKKASVISGVSDGATLYGTGGAIKFTTDEEGEFTAVNYEGYAQNFTVQGDDSVDFVLGYYTNSLGADAFQIEGIYNFESGTLIFDGTTGYHAFNVADRFSRLKPSDVTHFGDATAAPYFEENVTVQVADSQIVSIDGVSLVDNLKGNVTIHAVEPMTVNGEGFGITGDDDYNIIVENGKATEIVGISSGATLSSAGKAGKFITDEEGTFNLANYTGKTQNFTVQGDDSVEFVLEHYTRPDGEAAFQVDGVYNLENGTLIIDSATAYHAVNVGESVKEIVANKDKVMHFGDDRPEDFWNDYATLQVVDSQVVSIDGIRVMENIKGDVTVHGVGDMTVNGAEIYVDGDDDFNVIVEDGKVTSVVGIEDGATIDGTKITYVTDGDGVFVLDFTEYDSMSVTLDSSEPVSFGFNRNSLADTISGLNGAMYIAEGMALNINMNGTTGSISGAASIFGNGEELVSLAGVEDKVTIAADNPELIVALDNDKSVTINKTTFALSGDKDGVQIIGNEITDLGAGASLSVSKAGTYTVNGSAFDAKADDTFVATAEGVYIYNPNSMPVTTDTATEDVLTRFDVTAEPATVKTGETDLSTETVASAVELTSGNQSVTFNDRGHNAAIVSKAANGVKDIGLGDGGDLVVVEDTGADVSITTGANDDTIVNQGANTYIDMAAGGADKVYALGGTATLDNYHASTGSGLQTDFSDIGAAIENGKITFRTGEVSLSGAKVYVNDGYDDATLVDFYDINGEEQMVGFTNTEGGSIDLSPMNKPAIIVGGMQAASSLVGSANDDTIYAAAGDTINGYGGDNLVKLSTNRKINANGVAIEIPTVRSATIVENFKTGFDAGDDYIRADIDVSDMSYVDGDVVIKHDDSKVILKDVGDGSSAKILVDKDTSVVVGRGATAKVADEVADFYIGKKSALDFSDDYERDVSVNLAEGKGAVGAHDVVFYGFNTVTAGGGKTTLIGSEENEEFYAGSNDGTIYGGGGRDILHGYTGDDKNGSTEFFFDKDRATITGFEFTDGKSINPDKINTGAQGVEGVGVNGDDVYVELFNGGRLMIEGAAGKDFAIANDYGDVVAQISDGDLTYDGRANYFSTTTKSRAKLEVSSEVDNAEVWLNNGRSDEFHGNIYELDASAVEGNATLVGNDFDNVITAGKGNNSLWGGSSASNDTLIGGDGKDLFWYEMGNGNDVIQGAGSNDSVNLYGITVDMLTTEVTSDSITLKFNNGQTLKLDTNDGTTFQLADGSNWNYDKSDNSWKTK